jgi:hypothetical protein
MAAPRRWSEPARTLATGASRQLGREPDSPRPRLASQRRRPASRQPGQRPGQRPASRQPGQRPGQRPASRQPGHRPGQRPASRRPALQLAWRPLSASRPAARAGARRASAFLSPAQPWRRQRSPQHVQRLASQLPVRPPLSQPPLLRSPLSRRPARPWAWSVQLAWPRRSGDPCRFAPRFPMPSYLTPRILHQMVPQASGLDRAPPANQPCLPSDQTLWIGNANRSPRRPHHVKLQYSMTPPLRQGAGM